MCVEEVTVGFGFIKSTKLTIDEDDDDEDDEDALMAELELTTKEITKKMAEFTIFFYLNFSY
ncbi:hypothetical protein HanHA300_Chr00c0168g0723771 [Helianthus annuus]|nr:hypothetical protein HanHA89_Chr16g0639831 [Helianthus annuus]KAJ0634478.1 hypothetical protein HanHA300_Chr00c0168g0723771 [Helianthus annuus]KAJ0639157.1 hypothetical protein HanLR1_Chr16g0600751 [Helianthus annuus]KAJ0643124.1 hypothetical protein HanOQP8_Chr16g0597141 [Helianthus annuus]